MRAWVVAISWGGGTVIAPWCAGAEPASPPPKMSTPAQIERSCEGALAFAQANEKDAITLWDVSAGAMPSGGEGLWWHVGDVRQWTTVDALGAHGPNAQVSVWTTPGNLLFVSAFFTSDSGDWAYFVDYCFRPGGTVARISSTFNSFVAANPPNGVQRERSRYFDAKGKLVGSRSNVSDLQSKRPLKIAVAGNDEPPYMTVKALPFSALLRSVMGVQPPRHP